MNILKRNMLKMGVAVTVLAMVDSSAANAGNDGTAVTSSLMASLTDIPQIISGLAYIAGLTLGVLGILKIKDHVENPSQAPLKDGAIRLGAGGALLSLPMLMEVITESFGQGGAATGMQNVGNIQFVAGP